jgi:putative hydrolases of HD superfamily
MKEKPAKVLKKVFRFLRLTYLFRDVEREVLYSDNKRKENDLEHSGQLALLAWYLIKSQNLKLDENKAIKYALVHDLVEAYAGDTFIYDASKNKTKAIREKRAIQKLKKTYPEFSEMHTLIEEYESFANKESKFIYALDKLIPACNIYLDNGRLWKHHNVTLDMIIKNKTEKMKVSKNLLPLLEQLIKILKKEKHLFS